jgi:hypothetical protein
MLIELKTKVSELQPSDCPHRHLLEQSYLCEHPLSPSKYCTWKTDPIDYCPLSPEEELKMLQPYLRIEKINKFYKK